MLLYEFVKLRGRVNWGKFVAFGALYGVGCGVALYRRRRLGHLPGPVMARASREGFGQRDGVGRITYNPWDGGDRVELEATGNGLYRLWIWRRRPTQAGRGDSVDIVFHGDGATAAAIRQRVETFRAGALGVTPLPASGGDGGKDSD